MKDSNKTLMMIVLVVLVLLLFGSFGFGMMNLGGGMMGGYYSFNWLFSIIIFIALVLFIIWFFNQEKIGNKKGGKK